ncbi:transcriptional regulator, LysR family [Pasteurella testudinis DSM 23072]|uniref:Transcriptional regulator, LysR family n=1 Tax=Pasteurella testudinis DSM 23072 TaxID=1122938 RepID=A0A1W1V6K2_9PAST|nr:LysR family transcriptional regulator [Pasteurella testudinis]SMB89069.1 transcriptional regulator, LysR family [Pasteurella testudinis DSM 23072]SUB50210.1 glycine cleavage system transcriptional activator [Pasteurella testudinis]
MNSAIFGQLTVFHTIVREGNIAAAARKLHISATAVSKSLKLLEQQLGLPLFVRNTRSIKLTEAGRLLHGQTAHSLHNLEQAFDQVRELAQTPSGHIKITVSRLAYHAALRPLFAEFCQSYPQILLEVSLNDGTIDILAEEFDLGIRFGDQIDEGMVARKLLAPMREGLFASPAYLARHGTPACIDDLQQHKLIGYRLMTSKSLLPLRLIEQAEPVCVTMPLALICNDINMVNDAVCRHLGIGRIFEPLYRQEADKTMLVPVLEPHWYTYPPTYLYYLKNSTQARKINVLVDFLLARTESATPH